MIINNIHILLHLFCFSSGLLAKLQVINHNTNQITKHSTITINHQNHAHIAAAQAVRLSGLLDISVDVNDIE